MTSENVGARIAHRPKIMGILNVTPDSFSDGGNFTSQKSAIAQAESMIDAGADIIDIGGESTRPGAETVSIEKELGRVLPVIKKLKTLIKKKKAAVQISVDTRKADVAREAIGAGADIWNDVSALTFDDHSVDVAVELDCPLILMHALGPPKTMQDDPRYEDVIGEIKLWLATRIAVAIAAGVDPKNITIDPGIGFGKRLEDNLEILRSLSSFRDLECPILMGASRKSFIGKIDGSDAGNRLGGSIASAIWSSSQGADIIRVHDVGETVQALKVWSAINGE